jgi:hypothetical protein
VPLLAGPVAGHAGTAVALAAIGLFLLQARYSRRGVGDDAAGAASCLPLAGPYGRRCGS